MFGSLLKVTPELAAVLVGKRAHSISLIMPKHTFVSRPIGPHVDPNPMHFVVSPLALVGTTVCPIECASSVDVVFTEGAVILASVIKVEDPFSVLHSIFELALVVSAVYPSLLTKSLLLIVNPRTFVTGTI